MAFQICRICYDGGYNLLKLENDPHNYEKKLSSCIPEIDIYNIDNPGLCRKCADMLDTAFELRNLCLENEKRYNSTVDGTDKELTSSNCIGVDCNEDSIESAMCEIDENDDSQSLLRLVEIKKESTIFCSACNEEFSCNHDKKLHYFKKHRQLQHKQLRSLLSPINVKSNNLVETQQNIVQSDTVVSTFNSINSTVSNVEESADTVVAVTCTECDLTFTDNEELESHKLTHIKMSCDTCTKTFDTENEYNDHVKLHSIKCCGESFLTMSLLQLHTYREHNMTCGICEEKFTQFSALFSHLLDHVKDNWYKCVLCGKQFKTEDILIGHICNTSYLQQTVGEHVDVFKVQVEPTKNVKMKKYKKYICKKCNEGFKSRSLLTKHRYSAHTFLEHSTKHPLLSVLQDNLFACQLCGKEYKLNAHLKMHVLQVHCNKIPAVSIVDCRKDSFYRDQEGLRINFDVPADHLTDIKEVDILRTKLTARSRCICFICQLLFKNSSALYVHAKNEHVSCCDTNIMPVEMFLLHNLKHYNETEKEGDNGDILCLTCNVKHKNYVSLLAHICKSTFSKNEINMKKPKILDAKVKKDTNSRCTIEDHESDSPEESESATQESDNSTSNKSGCEICKKQFDCKSRLMDHIKTHI